MPRTLRPLALIAVSLALVACGGGSGSSATTTATGVGFNTSVTTLAFSTTQAVGTSGVVEPVTVSNNTSAAVSVSAITLTGANPAAFSMATNCPASVAAGASCTIWLTFGPVVVGAVTANLSIASSAATGTLVVALTGTGAAQTGLANVAPVVLDHGPLGLLAAGQYQFNQAFTTVTICTPGSTTACQVIDHVVIDTTSSGLQIMASVLAPGGTTPAGGAVPTALTIGGGALRECRLSGAGYTWGSVVAADVRLGGLTAPSVPVALINDAAAGSAPSDCAASANNLGSVSTLGVNGILGIASFGASADCPSCATAAQPTTYYSCPSGGACAATAVPLASQTSNPVALLPSDNNGVVVTLSGPLSTGSQSLTGTLTFGVATESNNTLGAAQLLAVGPTGAFYTVYNGATYTSYLSSGTVANYFYNATITPCTDYTALYCPTGALSQNATLVDVNHVATATTTFTVANADLDFTNYQYSALPGLSGIEGSGATQFIWGMPTFFGRSVYLLYPGSTVAGVPGPAIGLQ